MPDEELFNSYGKLLDLFAMRIIGNLQEKR